MGDSVKIVSLNAVTATGAGAQSRFGRARGLHTMQVTVTGAPVEALVNMEGSMDKGVTWGKMGTFSLVNGNVSGDMVTAATNLQELVRANLVTLTGGAAPTVTATIISDDD